MKKDSKSIYLIGFMGAGKSTIGKELAQRINYDFIDLDEWIEEHEKDTISTIFKEKGELYFRKLESEALAYFRDKKSYVIATGGGTPCQSDHIDRMNNSGVSIYLLTSIDMLTSRLYGHSDHRPLIRKLSKKQLKKFITTKLKARKHYYQQASIRVRCNVGVSQVVDKIIARYVDF